MFFDIGWSELLVIGVVALVFIGPKDLPRALRVAGYWFRKARTLSREFQNSVEQMVREAELDEVRDQLKKASEIDIDKQFRQAVDPTGDLAESLKPPELPDFFEPASSRPASEPAVIAGSADAAATETVATPLLPAADPAQPSLPFDVGEATAPEPDEVPAARHLEPPKP